MKFKLYASCVPVRGFRRSLIQDVQRNSYKFIPNVLHDILTNQGQFSIDEIKSFYSPENHHYIDSYFKFLIDEDLGFWYDNAGGFSQQNTSWDSPSSITNCIIDIVESSNHDYKKIAAELDDLGCQALQLRFYEKQNLDSVHFILGHFSVSRLRSIDILMQFAPDITDLHLDTLCLAFPRINSIIIHSSPVKQARETNASVWIAYTPECITDHSFCGVVDPSYFCNNIEVLTESLNFNSCLNRKVSIDIDGNIKNCPSMKSSFGNSALADLRTIITDPAFQELWTISKAQVEDCNVCEFRYMCIDCRAHIKDPLNILSKPSKCSYDPYTAKWQN